MSKVVYEFDKRDYERIKKVIQKIGMANSFQNVSNQISNYKNKVALMWSSWAMGGNNPSVPQISGIPRIKRTSATYAQSIKSEQTDGFTAKVYSDSDEARKIQEGKPAIEMKSLTSPWLTSKRTRVSKKGNPYLIIPFSWHIPTKSNMGITNVMPLNIYNTMKKKKASTVLADSSTSTVYAENIHGEDIARNVYAWGGRLSVAESNTKNAVGMVRFDVSDSRKRSTYFTFRVLSPLSKADWIIPAVPGVNVPDAIANQIKEDFNRDIAAALKEDLSL